MISSPFKASEPFRNGKLHTGVDIPLQEGTPLKAIKDGVIKLADYGDMNAGKTVLLETDQGTFIYGHLSEFLVNEGQKVSAGQTIALSGNTGYSTGSHLHLGLKMNGEFVDPTSFIDAATSSSWLQNFLNNGAIDSYDPILSNLPDLLTSLSVDAIMWVIIIFLLFFNKYTRIFTISSAILFSLFGG